MLCVKAASSIAEEATVVEQAPMEAPIFVELYSHLYLLADVLEHARV